MSEQADGAPEPTPYDVALEVTDEVLGEGAYADLNRNHPDPGVQRAIRRAARAARPVDGEGE